MENPQITFILVLPPISSRTLVEEDFETKTQKVLDQFLEKWQIPFESISCHHSELQSSLQRAKGSKVILTSAELTIPLGDLLKLLQVLHESPQTQLSFGNRIQKKNNPFLNSQQKRPELEKKMNTLFQEHLKGLFTDPLCPAVALNQKLVFEISEKVNDLAWPVHLRKISLQKSWRSAEVPVTDLGETHSQYPSFGLYLKYLISSVRL